jgi:hypothetical protein
LRISTNSASINRMDLDAELLQSCFLSLAAIVACSLLLQLDSRSVGHGGYKFGSAFLLERFSNSLAKIQAEHADRK